MLNKKNITITFFKLIIALGYSYGVVHFLQSIDMLNRGFLIGGTSLIISIGIPILFFAKYTNEV